MTPHICSTLRVLHRLDTKQLALEKLSTNSNLLKNWWFRKQPEDTIVKALKEEWEQMKTSCLPNRPSDRELLDKLKDEFDNCLLRSLFCKCIQVFKNLCIVQQLNNWRQLTKPTIKPHFALMLARREHRKKPRM